MLTRAGIRGLGDSTSPREATVLELLFDIVYVFALARLAGRVADDLTIVRHTLLSEAGQTLLFFTAMWMIWSLNALMASTFDPRRTDLQVVLLATMFGTLILAVSLPQAFGERGVVFACTYVVIQIGRPLYLTLALRGHPMWPGPARVLCWHLATGVLWVGGAISGGTGRGVFWTVALAIEVLGAATNWPTPIRAIRRGGVRIAFPHLAERYNQFFMIALAEVMVETGFAVSFPGLSIERTAILVAAFLAVVAYWRIYFYHSGQIRAAPANSGSSAGEELQLSQWASLSLLLIVGGIICTAVGFGQVVEDPDPPIDWALVVIIFGGPALFLIGRAFLAPPSNGRRRSYVLFVGVLALGLAAPPMVLMRPLAAVVTAALILVAVAVYDRLTYRRAPETNPAL
ncbi:low temperature requirement protein A [Micromonospora sp. NPDC051006]|uniref:low temperature requirement protein A n=1 Tax=Micromonospora sp. NPDC051006 TaxID=3364283 RepID=UPI0037BCB139